MAAPTLLNPLAKAAPVTPCLAMRPREAAASLSISERTLWTLTKRGEIPHVRIGRSILYSMDALRTWLDEKSKLPTKSPIDNQLKEVTHDQTQETLNAAPKSPADEGR